MHILLIARHYPPEVSGGARRPYLVTQALRKMGHQVTVVTPFKTVEPNNIYVPNRAIEASFHAQSQSTSQANNLSLLGTFKNWLRIWAFWPDPDIRWARSVVKAVIDSGQRPDWVMTTSPPESVHVCGAMLAKKLSIAWLAEMRDTWIVRPHRAVLARSKLRRVIERYYAKKTLTKASAITAVSDFVLSEMQRYAGSKIPNCIIPHFSKAPITVHDYGNNSLNLLHSGGFSLSDRKRHLGPLLAVLEAAYEKRSDIMFHIAGPLSANEQALIKSTSFPTIWHGSVSLEHSQALQAGADGLILYTPEDSHALPGKFAEYIIARRPILFKGGGSWMQLVDDKNSLRPIYDGILKLQKNEVVEHSHIVNAEDAAKMLIEFLEAQRKHPQ